jgi:copper chaperone CopZ
MKKHFLFLLIVLFPFLLYAGGGQEVDINPNYKLTIAGMTCELCPKAIEKKLSKVMWIDAVSGDHETGLVFIEVTDPPDLETLKMSIHDELDSLGYELIEVKEVINE